MILTDLITLNGNKMTSKEVLHRYLARKLSLPEYYGNNLDALHDCLTELSEELHLDVIHTDRLLHCLDAYGEAFLEVLSDSAEENPRLTVSFFSGNKE